MPRFGNVGRFDHNYELANVFEAMDADLQRFAGQYVNWHRFDAENSTMDPIYDVGSDEGGRRFYRPFLLPVLGADLQEGVEVNTGQGSYTTDVCHIVVSYEHAEKAGLLNLAKNWRLYLGDRFIYNDVVFQVRSIQVLGPVRDRYEVLGIDGWQVNPEELINDPQFSKYAGPGDVTTAHLAPGLVALDDALDKTPDNDSALQPTVGSDVDRDHDDDMVRDDSDFYVGPATYPASWQPLVSDRLQSGPVSSAPEDDPLYGKPAR